MFPAGDMANKIRTYIMIVGGGYCFNTKKESELFQLQISVTIFYDLFILLPLTTHAQDYEFLNIHEFLCITSDRDLYYTYCAVTYFR